MKSKILFSLLAATGAFLSAEIGSAQTAAPPSVRTPEADNTLGTQVSGNGNNFNIAGGLNRGQTLFHSFKDFSIPTAGAANFNNPAGTRDIITRVTGNLFSDINGTLNSNGANFLLINPNGVVFGPNAKLNVGKAFAASTASGVDLVDGQGRQITFGTNPNGDAPLLTINPNVFFNVSKLNMGVSVPNNPGIVNYGKLETNNDSQYIGLIGGNVTLDGKFGGGKIFAPGGRVDLGGLNTAGTVSTDRQGLVFAGNGLIRGDVLLTSGALVTARADRTLNTVTPFFSNVPDAGSNININANNLSLLNSLDKSEFGLGTLDNGLTENSGVKTNSGGDININVTGQVNLDKADILNTLRSGATGTIGDIKINANSLNLNNGSFITAITKGKGNAGNINITTTGDISISGTIPQSTQAANFLNQSYIASDTQGTGNAGKITIDTQERGKLLLSNNGNISSSVGQTGVGNSNTISIAAKEIDIQNQSSISSSTFGKGNAGNIDIKTIGDIRISSAPTLELVNPLFKSFISSDATGPVFGSVDVIAQVKPGNISIDTQNRGKLLLTNSGSISNNIISPLGVSNGQTISIAAKAIDIQNQSQISSTNQGIGDGGNINLKTIGDIRLYGSTPDSTNPNPKSLTNDSFNRFFPEIIDPTGQSFITTGAGKQGNAGRVTIDTQDRGKLLLDRSTISSTNGINGLVNGKDVAIVGSGNANDISISAQSVELKAGTINSNKFGRANDTDKIENANAGNIKIDTTGTLTLKDGSLITSTNNEGRGKAGDILLNNDRIIVSNSSIGSQSINATGGNIQINTRYFLLLKNPSRIATDSFSTEQNANGGNIKIGSPLIIALPGNNDIAANAVGGNGGRLDITSQGLFGIKYRPNGKESIFTNDITSSSEFGQSGIVNIITPGTDPGKDSTVLPTVPTDVSNQIAQTCNASRENKFIIAGRGGLPPNANDPLTSDVVWQDARAANNQPTASSKTTEPNKLPPPAVGLTFDGKGKAYLIAAGSQGQPTKTTVACPTVVKK